jgi:mannan endo-1,4-beta-mannosidase
MKALFQRVFGFITFLVLLAPAISHAGFSISNGRLLDDNGNPFIMRGINYPFAWFTQRYPTQTQQDFAAMAATGANTVRIVLGTGGQYPRNTGAQISQLIQWCKDNRMIAVLEVHDSTGWSEASTAVPISNATAYWLSSDVRAAINGQEDFVIVNIANEPFGNTTTANYVADTRAAIVALRNAGLTHNIMVDAANWGQDWSNTMRTNAQTLWNADPLRNLTFSVHMYEVYQSVTPISDYMQAFQTAGLPLVVGEFGIENNGQPVDEASVMAQAQQRGLGYIGWSWSGNGGCCVALDIVNNFNSSSLTTWGNILINGPNGISSTAVPATVFGPGGGTNTLNVSPTTLSLAAAANTSTISVTSNVTWSASDNATWLTLSPTSGANNGSFTVSAQANTGTTSRSGTVTVSGGNLQRTIAITQAGTNPGGGTDPVTVTRTVSSSGPWFNEEQVRISTTAPLTALSVTITMQRTAGLNYSGMYNTMGGQIQHTNSSTTSAITYQYTLASGQTLGAGTTGMFAAQAGGNGTAHPTSGDTYTVTYTSGGTQRTQTGTF